MDDGLSDNHRRVIASGMLIVDAAAVRMLDLLEDRNSPAAMKTVEGSVTESEREQVRASLLRLQALIASFVRKYDLQPSKKNLRRILASDVSQIWVALEDSRPARIRGYGAMPISSAESLEADLRELLLLANRLRALLNS
ncbi:hypothetical protein SBA7_1400013 [Candidatus Sulfotelmatobacter sp. SbA7]|nr:hypothetical protein SBA7_1400013 [Candidatus Sulfotelmatobacter sp. SbA7]